MKHVIIGAGRFSHTHLRVLAECGERAVSLCRRSPWSDNEMREYSTKHAALDINFRCLADQTLDLSDALVHVVTSSANHLDMMLEISGRAKRIFVEKPAVLLDTPAQRSNANILRGMCRGIIYQDDWLARLRDRLYDPGRPTRIKFVYDVKDDRRDIDLTTEIASHACNLMICWISPTEKVQLHECIVTDNSLDLSMTFSGNLYVKIEVTKGCVDQSQWSCQIDDKTYDSQYLGGALLLETFRLVKTGDVPATDWYATSWLIKKLSMLNDQTGFDQLLHEYHGD